MADVGGLSAGAESEPGLELGEAERRLAEIQHRMKNHLAMIVALIRLQARASPAQADFTALSRRVETLQLLYEELHDRAQPAAVRSICLGRYLARVVNAAERAEGRPGLRVDAAFDPISSAPEPASQIALVASELVTNALRHGFRDRDSGSVTVRVARADGGGVRLEVTDDGGGLPPELDWPRAGGLGGRIVGQFAGSLNAELSVKRLAAGTLVSLLVPAGTLVRA